MSKIGLYLAAYKANHPDYNIVYQDINGKRDLAGNMLDYDLNYYDFVIATPPCNFWSRARGNRLPSKYALETKNLLIDILQKLKGFDKPYIVENVRNDKRFNEYNLLNRNDCFIYKIGRHTYWTNIMFNTWVEQSFDYKTHGKQINSANNQGGINVYRVIESWLKEVHNAY